MSNLARKLLGTTSAGGLDIADAFSTDLYTGNSGTQTITNGIDLAGEGGLVWIKNRTQSANHVLVDTERADKFLISNLTSGDLNGTGIMTYNSDGYSVNSTGTSFNSSGDNFAAWTFRKAPRFFDVVTYTGDGVSGRTISHNLGIEPGMIVVKRRDSTGSWIVYHRANTGAPETDYLLLDGPQGTADLNTIWNDTAPTDTDFTVGTATSLNASGGTYVAYLFAHDTEADGVIQCGVHNHTNGSVGVVNLGWEPQFVLYKRADGASDWFMYDNVRGVTGGAAGPDYYLAANTSASESSNSGIDFTASGWNMPSGQSTASFIYMAIRKEDA